MRIAAMTVAAVLALMASAAAAEGEPGAGRYALMTARGASGLQADFHHWRLDTYTGKLSRCLANLGASTFECFDFPGAHPQVPHGATRRFELRQNLSVQNTVATSIVRFDTVTGALLLCETNGKCWTYEEGY